MVRQIGLPELLIIALVVILIFGIGRISKVGGELGKGIRSFREGLAGKDDDTAKPGDSDQGGPSA